MKTANPRFAVSRPMLPVADRSEFAKNNDASDDFSGEGTGSFSGSGEDHSTGEGFEAAGDDWINRDLGTRSEMEQTFDTGLDNVFTEEPSEAAARNAQDAAPTAFTEWAAVLRTTTITTSRLSLPPNCRCAIISPNSSQWR